MTASSTISTAPPAARTSTAQSRSRPRATSARTDSRRAVGIEAVSQEVTEETESSRIQTLFPPVPPASRIVFVHLRAFFDHPGFLQRVAAAKTKSAPYAP